MVTPVRLLAPEAVAPARRLYEQTDVPAESIAQLLGIGLRTFYQRRRAWGWKTRQPHRLTGDPALLVPASGEGRAGGTVGKEGDAATPTERRELIARLVRRIEAEIAAIERLVALAGLNAAMKPEAGPADGERAARTLAILVRSLRELAALEKLEPDRDDDDATRDADIFRRELGDTLERVLAGGEAS
ncbi:hypothetical protein EV667_1391 [Ancylobacter aquaticus]|uniref:Uncharacterized protein n=1 Tax=Ancylobacter aquaticus TaxID=100 RepID=A0A4R1IAJ4_ANCAQ|nr:hypothetical protein [Ancylobacter aquaticus]TCK31283.1 hypothetical protein EV667_1391 [Ancylobacter aquaticus]